MIPPEIVKALKSSCEMARVYARSIDVAPLREDIHRQAGIALAYLDTLPAAPAPDWSVAPDWAQWSILDLELGIRSVRFRRLYLEFEPELQHDMWRFGGRFESGELVQLPIGIDWRETLGARPTEDK